MMQRSQVQVSPERYELETYCATSTQHTELEPSSRGDSESSIMMRLIENVT